MLHTPLFPRIGRTAVSLLVLMSCSLQAYAQEGMPPADFDAGALLDAFRRKPDPAPEKPAQVAQPAASEEKPFVAVQVEPGRMPALAEHLAPYRKARFLEERHKIAPRLPVLGGDAITYFHLVATLDLAYLYATHGLWAETGSISKSARALHDRLYGKNAETDRELDLLRAEIDRLDGLVLLIDPRFSDERDRARPILEAYAKTWPDANLYRAILEIQSGKTEEAGPLLAAAKETLDGMPAAWRAQILPILLEGAVATGSQAMSETLFKDLTALAERTPEAMLPYLKGMKAEREANYQEAMDLYEKAAGHDDMFAQRSRIARIKLGLTQNLLDIEQARSELAIARNTWHGDDLALSALRLAVDIERDTGHPLEALLAIEEIRIRYPEARDIISEREKWDLVQAFYAPEDGSERPFADLLAGHRRISGLYGSEFGFLKYAESMGDQLRSYGALRLAGEEYARAIEAIDRLEEKSGRDPEPAEILAGFHDRLTLKEAEALLDIGEPGSARERLTSPLRDSSEKAKVDRIVLLRAKAAYASGNFSEVDDGKTSEPTPEHMRLIASARMALDEWDAAREEWIALFEVQGVKIEQSDLDSFTLASERAGKIAIDEGRIKTLSDVASDPVPAAYAGILADPIGGIAPLTRDVLTSHTERADRTLKVAKGDQP